MEDARKNTIAVLTRKNLDPMDVAANLDVTDKMTEEFIHNLEQRICVRDNMICELLDQLAEARRT